MSLKSLLENLRRNPHFRTFYIDGGEGEIIYRFPNGNKIISNITPGYANIETFINEKGEEFIKYFHIEELGIPKFIFYSQKDGDKIYYYSGGGEIILENINAYIEGLKEMVDLVMLLNLNVVAFHNYLKNTYVNEESYPIFFKCDSRIIYEWKWRNPCLWPQYSKNTAGSLLGPFEYGSNARSISSISLPLGEEMKGFLTEYLYSPDRKTRGDEENVVLFYSDEKILFYRVLNQDKRHEEDLMEMLRHVEKHNGEIKNHKDKEEGYISYLFQVMPKINPKSARK